MVTKLTNKTKSSANKTTLTTVKQMDPRDPDTKYFGAEPEFIIQPDADYRGSCLARAFGWYGRFYNRKDAKEVLAQYLDFLGKQQDSKILRKVEDNEIIITLCWLARMKMRGLVLTEQEETTLTNEIVRLLNTIHKPEIKQTSQIGGKKIVKADAPAKQNVQEIMREKARDAGGELEGLFDDFITQGSKSQHSFRPIDEVAKKNVLPQHISMLTEVWSKKLKEFQEVLLGKDPQLVQAYGHYSKPQVKNTIKFIELVISDLNSYISVKKASKAPRTKKAIPVEKIVLKMKYLKTFADTSIKLNLTSIAPAKIHNAEEVFLYDTQLRKLTYLVADSYSKTLTVKGTTILGFDTVKSQTKTLRKPGVDLPSLMKLGKPAKRKFFAEIKSVGSVPKGRMNDRTVILVAN